MELQLDGRAARMTGAGMGVGRTVAAVRAVFPAATRAADLTATLPPINGERHLDAP